MTPGMFPIPPSTTMMRIVMETVKPKFSGDTSDSLAP